MNATLRQMLNDAGCREILENAANDPARDRATQSVAAEFLFFGSHIHSGQGM